MPLATFPPKRRPGGLSTIVATLGLILYAVLSPFSLAPAAPPVHLSPVPAPGSTVYGNDISWPQCARSDGGNGLPGPQDSASFAVLGLTDGGSFRANPCLESQVESADLNNAVIDGVIAGYRAAGIRAGIYSYDRAWKAITGARSMPGVPTWVPVGLASRSKAAARCAVASYAGSKTWLTQWTDDVYDYNLTCHGHPVRLDLSNHQ